MRIGTAYRLAALLLLLLSAALCVTGCGGTEPGTDAMCLSFPDVGQSFCVLVETPDAVILFDTGAEDSEEYVCAFLRSRGITKVDLLFLSHLHDDHIGGADRVLSEFSVERVILPGYIAATDTDLCYRRFLDAAENAGILPETTKAGDSFRLGDVCLQVLWPEGEGFLPEDDENENCLVLRVVYGECAALLMADAEADAEAELLSSYETVRLRSDLLAVGHHGSATSTTEDFLDAVAPAVAVVSCGRNNPYGHPDARVLERLEDRGITMYRTDRDGSLFFGCDGQKIERRK